MQPIPAAAKSNKSNKSNENDENDENDESGTNREGDEKTVTKEPCVWIIA